LSILNLGHLLEQGGTTQVRFQPRFGQLLAAAAENVVSIFDVEADRQTHSLRVLVLNLEVEKTNETLLFHVCYLIAIKINNFFFVALGALHSGTLCLLGCERRLLGICQSRIC